MAGEREFSYMKLQQSDAERGCIDLADDPRLALLAACIANQQAAGFDMTLDLRQVPCPGCKAPGFNTGWGFFRHTCGAEIANGDDGFHCPIASDA